MPQEGHMKKSFDVIVVGGGGSGLAAAVSCCQQGLSVAVLEKRPDLGGTTGIAVGSFTANRTVYQRRAGIDDNPDDHETDAALFGPEAIQRRNNGRLRRYFLEHSAETLDWLLKMGIRFHGPSPEPPNRVPRMHNVVPNAKAYIAVLQSQLVRHRATVVCGARVERLVQRDGRVTGVVARIGDAQETTLEAKRGVVLAAGDYANSAELIAHHKGAAFADIEGINPHATGDGHRLAEQVGAVLVNMDITYGPELRFVPPPRKPFSQLLPANGLLANLMGRCLPLVPKSLIDRMIKRLLVTWQHPEDALFADGAILVNQSGERFCDERSSPNREIAIAKQPGKQAYILLDGHLSERYSQWPHFVSTAPEIAYAYIEDYCRMRRDVTVQSLDLAQLADARSISADSLRETIRELGTPDAHEPGAPHRRMASGPWVLLGPVKAYFTTTEGGAQVNESLQVLDRHGETIPGCYAVGQNGLAGQVLWGHGLHIAWAITSGRLVGHSLAR
jgi:fumarate reductase flavoprotein subunit